VSTHSSLFLAHHLLGELPESRRCCCRRTSSVSEAGLRVVYVSCRTQPSRAAHLQVAAIYP
jgi:hypothetical protein